MIKKITGKVERYNSIRGFGIIIGSDGKEYFVHTSRLSSNMGGIKIGTRLVFEAIPSQYQKGAYEAIHIELDNSPILEPSPEIPPTIDSGVDYWYQSYSNGENTSSQIGPKKESLETKVVGVTYEGRQSIVALLKIDEDVLLVRDPGNPYDGNAIKVIRKDGQCFGYISSLIAASLASKFDKYGQPVEAAVKSLTKGYSSDSNLGVTIQFNIPEISNDNSGIEL